MDNYERQWIELICKVYPNLHNDERVMHVAKESDKKVERIKKYFEKLDIIHQKVSQSKRKSNELFLKELYYDLYVIKEKNIPESYYKSQVRLSRERGYGNIELTDEIKHNYATQIIKDQQLSLDKWIEYFLYDDEAKSYEMWEKYWVFQGIANLGLYDKETQKFKKRDLSTIASFPTLDREAIFSTLKIMEEYIKNKKGEAEIKSALGNGNFKTLYEYSIKQMMNNGKYMSISTDGKWIKYDQGSDYHVLRDSLQDYYTGWCTAAGENFAKDQLEGGDFYVYYSYDSNGEATVPRLAIRMDGSDIIGEIRGIAKDQNIEAEMMPILEKKLKDFPDRDKYLKKESDMRFLTLLEQKVNNNEELTLEELKFLYEIDYEIDGFGYSKDPRIDEIRNRRNQKRDYYILYSIYNVQEDEIALSAKEYLEVHKEYKLLIGDLNLDVVEAKKLILPKVIIGNLYMPHLKSAKYVTLPQVVKGNLYLNGLTTVEGLKLPQEIAGSLDLNSLKTAYGLEIPSMPDGFVYLSSLETANGVKFPKKLRGLTLGIKIAEGLKLPQEITANLILNDLKTAKGLEIPETIGGHIYLNRLETAEGLKFPKTLKGLSLFGITTAKGLNLPENVTEFLGLESLTSAIGLILPKKVGELNLRGLKTPKGLDLSHTELRSLFLHSLTTAEGLILPEILSGSLYLNSLTIAKGLKLPKKIGNCLDLSSLISAEGLKFPEIVGGFLDLSSLKKTKGLTLPREVGGMLDLSSLISAEDLYLPNKVGGYLKLNGLETSKGLNLPPHFSIDKLRCKSFIKMELVSNRMGSYIYSFRSI